MEISKLEQEVMNLNIDERALLAEKLILSLDAPSETDNLKLWVKEAERRLKEMRADTTKEISAKEVFMRAKNAIL